MEHQSDNERSGSQFRNKVLDNVTTPAAIHQRRFVEFEVLRITRFHTLILERSRRFSQYYELFF